ncbi:MAG: homoserine O-succinyltransferase [Chitinophagaceae bacterium]|nr:homoserine O-succinyltransferase [Chitinophagaceae bacterium]MCW5925773.1 homoserine O-succinyltransferase [Chitinophagaceae bacterium]
MTTKPLRIHYLQHVPFEGPGYIKTWAEERGHILSATRFYRDDALPATDDFDWLIIMGGPMGVYDEDKFHWLAEEKTFIKNAIRANKTIIGICLGSQLLAEVSGARVYPNTQKEIGWFPVSLTSGTHPLTDGLPEKFEVLHWHGDTFDLPENATHLMQTAVCKNQAFIYDNCVLGLQFHLEATPETLAQMIENCRDELVAGDFIQSEESILQQKEYCAQTNAYLARILDRLA